MEKNDKYYGIRLNKKIPKIDKVNKFSKKVEFEFEGTAYIVMKKGEETQRVEICNGHKLEKEGEYEIEFTNLKNEIYNLQITIESYFWVIFLILFLGFVIGIGLSKSINSADYPVSRIYDYINLAILDFKSDEDVNREYGFDVSFRNIAPKEISLKNTINAKALSKNKIAPRRKWQFFNFDKCEK